MTRARARARAHPRLSPDLVQDARQVVAAPGGIRVALAQDLAKNVQGPLVEGLGLGIPALRVQVVGQVVVAVAGLGVPLAQDLAADVQGPLEQRLGVDDPKSGEEIAAIVRRTYQAPPEDITRLRKMLAK